MDESYGHLAKNLMIAFMAHRLGNKIATEEKNWKPVAPEHIGPMWYKYAELIEKEFVAGIDELMRRTYPGELEPTAVGKIQ